MPKSKYIRDGKVRGDMKVAKDGKAIPKIKGKEDRYVAIHHEGSYGTTKKEFMTLLKKSAQPLKPDSKAKETSESHLSDDCSDTHKNPDKTVDKEGLPSD